MDEQKIVVDPTETPKDELTVGKPQEILDNASNQKPTMERNPRKHSPDHKRGIGFTQASHEQSKKARKVAANSRRMNRGKK